MLSGIAPPVIRRDVCARVERYKQSTRETHSLFGHIPATKCLKSRHCFLSSVQPTELPRKKVIRCNKWWKRLRNKPHISIMNLHEEMAKGYDSPWTTWKCLNRLRTGMLVGEQKKPRYTYYSSPNLHIPAFWMTFLRSMM